MRKKKLRFGEGFRVVPGNRASQAAEMVLAPGAAEGTLVFIERRERHEVKNTGRALLSTLNFYVPPAYRRNGDPLPRGRK